MAIEIERKFRLTRRRLARADARSSTLLRQGYLANTARASVRVRLAGNAGWLSVKAMTPGLAARRIRGRRFRRRMRMKCSIGCAKAR